MQLQRAVLRSKLHREDMGSLQDLLTNLCLNCKSHCKQTHKLATQIHHWAQGKDPIRLHRLTAGEWVNGRVGVSASRSLARAEGCCPL